jgi:hydroxypyruvate isomerase
VALEVRLSTPRGQYQSSGRPGTGKMNYVNIFKHMTKKMRESGRDFIFGMEHGRWKPDKAGERARIESYVAIDAAL